MQKTLEVRAVPHFAGVTTLQNQTAMADGQTESKLCIHIHCGHRHRGHVGGLPRRRVSVSQRGQRRVKLAEPQVLLGGRQTLVRICLA